MKKTYKQSLSKLKYLHKRFFTVELNEGIQPGKPNVQWRKQQSLSELKYLHKKLFTVELKEGIK